MQEGQPPSPKGPLEEEAFWPFAELEARAACKAGTRQRASARIDSIFV